MQRCWVEAALRSAHTDPLLEDLLRNLVDSMERREVVGAVALKHFPTVFEPSWEVQLVGLDDIQFSMTTVLPRISLEEKDQGHTADHHSHVH